MRKIDIDDPQFAVDTGDHIYIKDGTKPPYTMLRIDNMKRITRRKLIDLSMEKSK